METPKKTVSHMVNAHGFCSGLNMVCKTIDVNGWNLFQHVELFVRKIKWWRYLSFVLVTRSPNNEKQIVN